MLDVVVADTEVYKHYFVLVALELPNKEPVVITDRSELQEFYHKHKDGIWCFYNASYDKYIVRAALCGMDVYDLSQHIVNGGNGWEWSRHLKGYPLNCFDAKRTSDSLKVLEGYMGEDIEETSVPFDLDRELTPEEQRQVIAYCKHDVEQTYKVLQQIKPTFEAQYNLCRKFELPMSYMSKTPARLASSLLKAQRATYNDEFDVTFPSWLRIDKYGKVLQWFRNELAQAQYLRSTGSSWDVYSHQTIASIGGVQCFFAWGGLHGALPQYHAKGLIACYDVASLYPSLMINEGYFSRSLGDPKLYENMYHERLELKKAKNPLANSYKLVLNSTYGTLKDPTSDAYDPLMANNICVAGQLALLDLMEHVETKVDAQLLQCNTDSVYYLLPNEEQLEELRKVTRAWEARTKLTLEETLCTEIHQRDVNNYLLITSSGKVKGKGVLKEQSPLDYNCPIVKEAIREYFVHGTKVEDTINNCDEYIKFQIVYKRSAKFDCVIHNDCCYTDKRVFRVFADKRNRNTSLYRGKRKGDELNLTLFPNCPPSVFIDNGEVKGRKVPSNVNKSWYIDAARSELSSWFGDGLGLAD